MKYQQLQQRRKQQVTSSSNNSTIRNLKNRPTSSIQFVTSSCLIIFIVFALSIILIFYGILVFNILYIQNNNDNENNSSSYSKNNVPPALIGASHGTIQCEIKKDNHPNRNDDNDDYYSENYDKNTGNNYNNKELLFSTIQDLVYWNDPQGNRDNNFKSPFAAVDVTTTHNEDHNKPEMAKNKYVTFEPDNGGWNNIRMSFENIVVFAATTGRILVLPPEQPFYLLRKDEKRRQRNFFDFFDFDSSKSFKLHIPKVITTEEFIRKEVSTKGGQFYPISEENNNKVISSMKMCQPILKSDISCRNIYDYFSEIAQVVPYVHGEKDCLIFDEDTFFGKNNTTLDKTENNTNVYISKNVETFCSKRKPFYFTQEIQAGALIHFRTSRKETRVLVHFYSFIYFTNPKIDNFYKRFIRDTMHYRDEIFCIAAKIVNELQKQGKKALTTPTYLSASNSNNNNNNANIPAASRSSRFFSSLHIRRGDFQWKKMRISCEEWYENTKEHWLPNEILYITTDEKNKSFFDPIKKYHKIFFFDDFYNGDENIIANNQNKNIVHYLNKAIIDPNWVGMIEAVIASRGRIFVGTYFSSFSAYIGRMRGYQGLLGKEMFYGQSRYKFETQNWTYPHSSYSAREFPIGWVNIDYDDHVYDYPDGY